MTTTKDTTSSENKAAIAIHRIMSRIGYVRKTGRHPKFTYASESDMIQAVRNEMVAEGLVLSIVNVQPFAQDIITTGKTPLLRVAAVYRGQFIHAASGHVLPATAIGEGTDYGGDKAGYKANTGAEKYILRQTFLLEVGDAPSPETTNCDPEQNRYSPAPAKKPNRKEQAQQAGEAVAGEMSKNDQAREALIEVFDSQYELSFDHAPTKAVRNDVLKTLCKEAPGHCDDGSLKFADKHEVYAYGTQLILSGRVDLETGHVKAKEEATA